MLNLLVLRVQELERSMTFYRLLGLEFQSHQHGKGSLHYAAELGIITFELYPCTEKYPVSSSTRIGFHIEDMDKTIKVLEEKENTILSKPKLTEWGLRAVVLDPDEHRVELVEKFSKC